MLRTTLVALFLFAPALVAAQAIPGLVRTPTIELRPQYPGPHDTVTATVRLSGEDMSAADIVWLVNGETTIEGTGAETYTFTTGAPGAIQTLSVLVRTATGETSAEQAIINPARVSLAWEAATYTPPLYKGRALYSAGAGIRAEVFTEFIDASGTRIPKEALVYTWRRNGSAIPGASGRGRNTLRVVGPKFFGTDIISVRVSNAEETLVGTAAARIATTDPVVVLYPWNPLLGTLFYSAVARTNGRVGESTTVVAEPYYISARTAADPQLSYEWRIGGRAVTPNPDAPQYVSLAADETIASTIGLSITHTTELLQEATGRWSLSFEDEGLGLFGL